MTTTIMNTISTNTILTNIRITSADITNADSPLRTRALIGGSTTLLVALLCCLALAIVCVTTAILASRIGRRPHPAQPAGAHSGSRAQGPWRARVDDILRRYHDGSLDRDAAFTALAKVARDYASHVSGTPMTSHTLADIGNAPRNPGNRHGLDLFRQTIAALYPPEFADTQADAAAREASVDQAGEWVLRLVQRWRR
ncbi:hypothetical protein [Bifidobacterium mongoliense]|jgi:hypothetical protein|uniref:Uncharacterized protein n=3 Tax=Bifidobacterium mongoliense TaxID=518643 RepID=A0A087CAB7_9BIFI|nr:hypothetical protein [Bifidobacterium mongoliense]KFI80217.1 hypothetical protein BMON_0085 [Bifidobacterium mongoliense DSM 21395]MDN5633417.1 hypothetical protein [Bifidobacterium mongoliense]MDN6026044.1 hypothetical protein [Bifidobacterium mongoliense]MDN6051784.1 hypothetical protein [Bifidobacterium mongoliense]MDN6720140.1 hypothetical protein [Bifidobacterium mongoliense]